MIFYSNVLIYILIGNLIPAEAFKALNRILTNINNYLLIHFYLNFIDFI